jgi:hypothetical protein
VRLGDQYVVARLNERTQDADLSGLVLRWVGPTPVIAATPTWLDETACQNLMAHANVLLAKSVAVFRRALTDLSWNAQPLAYLTAAASESGAANGLIHTNYFSTPEVRAAIIRALQGDQPDTQSLIAPPKLRRRTRPGDMLFAAYTIVAGAFVLTPYAISVSYMRPLIREQVVRDAIEQAPVPSASWEVDQGPPETVRLIGRLADIDQITNLASKLPQTSSPLRMYSELSLGLADRGVFDLAQSYINKAKQYTNVDGAAEIRSIGPALAISKYMKSYTRALARLGAIAEIDNFITGITRQIDDGPTSRRAADELSAEAAVGFNMSGNQPAARHELGKISDDFVKRDAVSTMIEHTSDLGFIESVITQILAQDLRLELVAELISKKHSTLAMADLSRLLGSLDRAAPRASAAAAFAERLGREGKAVEGIALIEADFRAFNSRPREPLEGLRIHFVRYAAAMFVLGKPDRARSILEMAEALPLERVGDTTYSDFSAPDRAVLWARLGNTEKAVSLAREHAENNENLLRDVGRLLRKAVGATTFQKAAENIADPLERTRLIVGSLVWDSNSLSNLQVLRDLTSNAQSIIDPQAKSETLAEIAKGWIRAGSYRKALEIGTITRSHHFLGVVADMVAQFYDQRGLDARLRAARAPG